MRNLLYIIAVILVLGWAIGVFAYSAGGIIHILLIIAIVAILLNVIRGGKVLYNKSANDKLRKNIILSTQRPQSLHFFFQSIDRADCNQDTCNGQWVLCLFLPVIF
jgi:hypothetical protein